MSTLLRLLQLINNRSPQRPIYRNVATYQPHPPIGFVRRSDPNFYYLARR